VAGTEIKAGMAGIYVGPLSQETGTIKVKFASQELDIPASFSILEEYERRITSANEWKQHILSVSAVNLARDNREVLLREDPTLGRGSVFSNTHQAFLAFYWFQDSRRQQTEVTKSVTTGVPLPGGYVPGQAVMATVHLDDSVHEVTEDTAGMVLGAGIGYNQGLINVVFAATKRKTNQGHGRPAGWLKPQEREWLVTPDKIRAIVEQPVTPKEEIANIPIVHPQPWPIGTPVFATTDDLIQWSMGKAGRFLGLSGATDYKVAFPHPFKAGQVAVIDVPKAQVAAVDSSTLQANDAMSSTPSGNLPVGYSKGEAVMLKEDVPMHGYVVVKKGTAGIVLGNGVGNGTISVKFAAARNTGGQFEAHLRIQPCDVVASQILIDSIEKGIPLPPLQAQIAQPPLPRLQAQIAQPALPHKGMDPHTECPSLLTAAVRASSIEIFNVNFLGMEPAATRQAVAEEELTGGKTCYVEEWVEGFRKLGVSPELKTDEQLIDDFQAADANNDNFINVDEFLFWMCMMAHQEHYSGWANHFRTYFDTYDVNQDGKLSHDELQALLTYAIANDGLPATTAKQVFAYLGNLSELGRTDYENFLKRYMLNGM
jgi:Ca2+-binding EF-hand superfamily protein